SHLSHVASLQRAVSQRLGFIKEEEPRPDHQPTRERPGLTSRNFSTHASSTGPTELSAAANGKESMDHLIATYLTREYVNMPIFQLSEFRTSCEDVAETESFRTGSTAFHGVLNLVISLACMNTNRASAVLGSDFYARGQATVSSVSSLEEPLVLIQSFLLQSQYLNAVGNPRLAWATVGVAIRTAQSLGLNLKSNGHDQGSRQRRELARRLWHSAAMMESILALQVGIPPQTPHVFQVPLPSHSDSDYLDAVLPETSLSSDEPAERPSMVEFLAACARLYSHVGDIMSIEDEFRVSDGGCSMKKLLSSDMKLFLKVDALSHDWKSSLPSFLQEQDPGPYGPIALRQRTLLQVRFYYLRIRLYRPLLTLALAITVRCNCSRAGHRPHLDQAEFASPELPMVYGISRDASIKCISAAVKLVNLLHWHDLPPQEEDSSNPGYWESVNYLHACGVVLIGARMSPFIGQAQGRGCVSPTDLEASWHKVLELLEYYAGVCRAKGERLPNTAQLCLRSLNIFSDAVGQGRAEGIGLGIRPDQVEDCDDESGRSSDVQSVPERSRRPNSWSWMESLPIDLVD
ncbi:hypothetical protein ASPZODRAFT_58554, partial [Penicilliopsis zonata CBS 506.65]